MKGLSLLVRQLLILMMAFATTNTVMAQQASVQPTSTQQTPSSVTLRYDVRFNGISLGEAVHVLKIDGSQYTIEDTEKAAGIVGLFVDSITRKSQGTIVDKQLRPTQYSESTKEKSRTATLNWNTMTATFTVDPNKQEKFKPDTVDRVSFAYQYYVNGKVPSGVYTQMVADVKKVEDQTFKVVGMNAVETPMGKINALKVERAGDAKKNLSMWLSPQHQYLPVRLIFVDNKENVFDQRIVEIVK